MKSRCRDCANAWKAGRSPAEKKRERDAWRGAHQEQRAAARAVGKAVARGTLVRPEACEGCGEAGPVQAHHSDYERRLDVRWLCVACHSSEHTVKRVRVDMRLPEDLLEAVDAAKGDASRTRFVERALREALAVPKVAPRETPTKPMVPARSVAERVPGVRPAREFVKDSAMLERQRKLNEGKG